MRAASNTDITRELEKKKSAKLDAILQSGKCVQYIISSERLNKNFERHLFCMQKLFSIRTLGAILLDQTQKEAWFNLTLF